MSPGAEKLKAKLEEWRRWMNAKDPHSITYQIYQMIWDDAVYRVINECRRLSPTAEEDGVQLNGTIHRFIDKCYFRLQPLAIRRLVERNPRREDRHIISLRRLLDDIRAQAHLVTRKAFFEAEGLAYDYAAAKEAAERDAQRWFEEATARGGNAYWPDPELENAWERPRDLHADFDRFSKTNPDARSESDALDPCLIDALCQRLKVCDGVQQYVNKRVAHAADPANRDQVSEEAKNLCIARIEECHKAICGVASFVSVYLLRGAQLSPLPIPQFDQLAYIEKPWVRKEDVAHLANLWNDFERETHDWGTPQWPSGW